MLILVQLRRPALDDERRRANTAAANVGERPQVIVHERDRASPLVLLGLGTSRREHLPLAEEADLLEEPLERRSRQQADESTERDRDDTERERDAPFATADPSDLERSTTNEDDDDLDADFCGRCKRTDDEATEEKTHREE